MTILDRALDIGISEVATAFRRRRHERRTYVPEASQLDVEFTPAG